MIIAVDIETRGLDATKFICGAVVKENGVKKVFNKKEDMWKYILDLGEAEYKRGKVLSVYAHNHSFDFHGYADLTDTNIVWFSLKPFIVAYRKYGKEIIKFLDTMAIFHMSLKKLGELVGLKKLEMPKELFNENTKITKSLLTRAKPYMIRDAEIVLKAIKYMKEKIKEEQIQIKRLYTINQIAIGFMINKLKQQDREDTTIIKGGYTKIQNDLFDDKSKGVIRKTKFRNCIHEAYRGGRVEAWKLGVTRNVTYLDCNSLYPYSTMTMRFPRLNTELFIKNPLKITSKQELFKRIGISRALVFNEKNNLGLLPIRTTTGNYYPKSGKYMIGTWTNKELQKAEVEGYKVIKIQWSIIYEEGNNPYREILPTIYKKRKHGDEFNSYFYKMIMNASFGKMAQRRVNQEIVTDSVEEAQNYLAKNYEIIKGIEYNYMYRKSEVFFTIFSKPYPYKAYKPLVET